MKWPETSEQPWEKRTTDGLNPSTRKYNIRVQCPVNLHVSRKRGCVDAQHLQISWFKQWSWNKFAQQGAAECSDPHWQKIEATTRAPEHGWNRRKVITNTDTSPRWSEGSPTSWFDNRAHSRVVREGVNPKQTHLQKWGELICTLHFTVHQLNSLQSWSFASFLFSLQVSWYTGARKSSGFHK